ncbi:hypothetical protein F2P81_015613 [Scophthalmus maximus]|uniref:Uncharacterized protein n=1 Tax=Scophthalmus maximus TaxID=52904 RepID=A0A6A4SFP9_SCOMX|nr:hypothetical protein F2P81_015613 [Scophthalmus maximus]
MNLPHPITEIRNTTLEIAPHYQAVMATSPRRNWLTSQARWTRGMNTKCERARGEGRIGILEYCINTWVPLLSALLPQRSQLNITVVGFYTYIKNRLAICRRSNSLIGKRSTHAVVNVKDSPWVSHLTDLFFVPSHKNPKETVERERSEWDAEAELTLHVKDQADIYSRCRCADALSVHEVLFTSKNNNNNNNRKQEKKTEKTEKQTEAPATVRDGKRRTAADSRDIPPKSCCRFSRGHVAMLCIVFWKEHLLRTIIGLFLPILAFPCVLIEIPTCQKNQLRQTEHKQPTTFECARVGIDLVSLNYTPVRKQTNTMVEVQYAKDYVGVFQPLHKDRCERQVALLPPTPDPHLVDLGDVRTGLSLLFLWTPNRILAFYSLFALLRDDKRSPTFYRIKATTPPGDNNSSWHPRSTSTPAVSADQTPTRRQYTPTTTTTNNNNLALHLQLYGCARQTMFIINTVKEVILQICC